MKALIKLMWNSRIVILAMFLATFFTARLDNYFGSDFARIVVSAGFTLVLFIMLATVVIVIDRIESNFHSFTYNSYTRTIRTEPESYWVATVNPDRTLKFDSWDGAIVGRYSKLEIWIRWKLGLIPHKGTNLVNDTNLTPEQEAWLEKANSQDDGATVFIINGKVVVKRF